MKKWILTGIAFIFVTIISNVWADTSADNKLVQTVIENWFAAMKNDPNKAGNFLAPEFVSIHTDGIVRDKNQEIVLIKNLQMKNYNLTHFKFSRSGDVIVVTYLDQTSEKIDAKQIGTEPAGRMAVLQKKNGKWMILAYANLDKIG